MKKIFEDRIGFDDMEYDDPFNNNDDAFDDIDDINTEEELKHLCYLLREMFRNKRIYNVSVYNEDMNIIIDVVFNKTAKLEKVIEVFSIANKIKKETLPQYVDSFQIYEDKDGSQIISFEFVLDYKNSGYDYNYDFDPNAYPYY